MMRTRRLGVEAATYVLGSNTRYGPYAVRQAHTKSGVNIVLEQTVDKLGQAGEQVEASRGFARNYLIPGGLARQLPKLRNKISGPGQAAEAKRLKGKGTAVTSAQNLEHVLNLLYNRPVEIVRKPKPWPNPHRLMLRQPVTPACIVRAALDQHKVLLSPQLFSTELFLSKAGTQEVPLQLTGSMGQQMKMRVRIMTNAVEPVDDSPDRSASETPPFQEQSSSFSPLPQ